MIDRGSDMEKEDEKSISRTLKCPQCEIAFPCLLTLDNHIRFHTKEHPYECSKCHESFRYKKDLNKHSNGANGCEQNSLLIGVQALKTKTECTTAFACVQCDKKFASPYGLARHKRLHSGERPFECVECMKKFIDSGDLSKHMKTHEGETTLQCEICEKICISKKRLEEHMFKHNGKQRYQCCVCSKVCKCKSHLDEHMRTHSREKPFSCYFCDVRYRYKSQLKEHTLAKHPSSESGISQYSENRVECDLCGTVLSRTSLRHHKLLHKDKRYNCDHCDKTFISKYRLTVHKRCHSGERPFLCEVSGCGKGLTTKDGLMRHMVIHNGKKNFKCQQCSREFFYLSNLNQHVKTHSESNENKRYSCSQCNKCFSRKSILKKHQRLYSTVCNGFNFKRPKATTKEMNSGNDDDRMLSPGNYELLGPRGGAQGYLIIHENTPQYFIGSDCMMANKHPVKEPSILGPTHTMTIEEPMSVVFVETDDLANPSWPSVDGTEQLAHLEVTTQREFVMDNSKYQSLLGQALCNLDPMPKNRVTSAPETNLNSNQPLRKKVNAEAQTDNNWNSGNFYLDPNGSWSQEKSVGAQTQTTTILHQIDNKMVEVQHPNDIVLSEDDLSNLMTLAGVSSKTDSHLSQSKDIVLLTFGGESVKINNVKNIQEVCKDVKNSDKLCKIESVQVNTNGFFPRARKVNEENPQEIINEANDNKSDEPFEYSIDATEEEEEVKIDGYILALSCLHCSTMFKFHYALEEHCLACHPGLDIYKCFDCDETFESTRILLKHSLIHNGNSCVQCKLCSKMFTHPQKMTSHLAQHMGQRLKRFKCEFCTHRFQDRTHLRDHLMVHSGNKPFVCDVCGHKFVRKRDLETHQRIHTGELPFLCTICHKSFRAANYLKNHMLVHADNKPFQCSECNKSYIKRSKLALHMLNHTGNKPYKCIEPGCDKSYSDKREFMHHQMRHRGEKPHKCPICYKSFTMRSNMYQHKRTHHK